MGVGSIPASKIKEHLTEELELTGFRYRHAYAVLRRVDDAYLGMVNESGRSKTGREPETEVRVDDTSGVKALFGRLSEKQKQAKKQNKK